MIRMGPMGLMGLMGRANECQLSHSCVWEGFAGVLARPVRRSSGRRRGEGLMIVASPSGTKTLSNTVHIFGATSGTIAVRGRGRRRGRGRARGRLGKL